MTPITVVAIVVAVLAIAIAIWALLQWQKTRHLRTRFGPEYEREVRREGNTGKAENVLERREKRVAKYNIRKLTPPETDQFASEWRGVQEHFVDNPRQAVSEADRLIDAAMNARGYPVSDFEAQAADLSVDYPVVVEHYRAAHAIDIGRSVNTEELRNAMRHYHELFDQIIGINSVHQHEEVR